MTVEIKNAPVHFSKCSQFRQRKIQFIFLLLFLPILLYSQHPARMNVQLIRAVNQQPSSARYVPLLVKGDPDKIKAACNAMGGFYKYAAGDIVALALPLNKVTLLAEQEGVFRIEGMYGRSSAT